MDLLHLPDLLGGLSDLISIITAGTGLAAWLYARIRRARKRRGPGNSE
jgi:hypothetical protein